MRHPRARAFSRRDFLRTTAAAALAASGGASLLAACGGDDAATGETIPLARPDNPVTLPIRDDIPAIADGLEPESGMLRIFNWEQYIDQPTVDAFAEQYGVSVEISTFSTMEEGIAKLRTGAVNYDVFFPTVDRLGRLVAGGLLQPLNRSYLPNLEANVWPELLDPFYDTGAQYSAPYTVYTTGIGYRSDIVTTDPGSLANPYDVYFDTAYAGNIWLLDDVREAISMMLLRNGVTDLNTGDEAALQAARDGLFELLDTVGIKISVDAYTKLPEGLAAIHQAWSGDLVNAQYYMPDGADVTVVNYWYPPDGGGPIGSDMMTVLAGAERPVLAHHFINFFLDVDNSLANYAWNGYQPPLTALDPERLVADGYVPEHLQSAVVRPQDFERGFLELELDAATEARWNDVWAEFTAGA